MQTIYVKARVYLSKFNEDTQKVEKLTVNHRYLDEFRKRGLGDLKQVLNNHLLNYALCRNAFIYRQELMLEDLKEYSDLSFVQSIIPIHIGLQFDWENPNNFFDRDIPLYLYFKVVCKEKLSSSEASQLLEEMKGQLSDGWGEGFEQQDLDLSGTIYGDKEYKHIEDDGWSISTLCYEGEKWDISIVPSIESY